MGGCWDVGGCFGVWGMVMGKKVVGMLWTIWRKWDSEVGTVEESCFWLLL